MDPEVPPRAEVETFTSARARVLRAGSALPWAFLVALMPIDLDGPLRMVASPAAVLLAVTLVVRAGRIAIAFGPSDVRIKNLLWTHRVAWSEVTRIDIGRATRLWGPSLFVRFHAANGHTYVCDASAFPGTVAGTRLRQLLYDHARRHGVVARLRVEWSTRTSAASKPGSGSVIVGELRLRPRSFGVAKVSGFSLSTRSVSCGR